MSKLARQLTLATAITVGAGSQAKYGRSTLIFAKLNLGEITGQRAEHLLNKLFDKVKDKDWESGVREDINLYNTRYHKDDVDNQVKLNNRTYTEVNLSPSLKL
jgi:hypothetical protein